MKHARCSNIVPDFECWVVEAGTALSRLLPERKPLVGPTTCCFAPPLSSDSCFETQRAGLTRSRLCLCRSPCSCCIRRLAAIFVMIHTVRRTQRVRYPVVTYSATGTSARVPTVVTRAIFAYPFPPASSHPQMPFRVPTERVPVVSKKVLELLCHET